MAGAVHEEGLSEDGLELYLKGYVYPARGKSAAGESRERYMQKAVQLLVDGEPVRIKQRYLEYRNLPEHTARILTRSGFVGGKEVLASPVDVLAGKNIGKSNETSAFEQAVREATSATERIMRKRDVDAAVDPEAENDTKPLVPAMLLKKNLQDADEVEYPIYMQPKLDGVRCTVTAFAEEMAPRLRSKKNAPEAIDRAREAGFVAYSRQFIIYPVWHLKVLLGFLKAHPNLYIDGELMAYDDRGETLPLQTIMGTALKKSKAHLTKLRVFDVFDYTQLQLGFEERRANLELLQDYLDAGDEDSGESSESESDTESSTDSSAETSTDSSESSESESESEELPLVAIVETRLVKSKQRARALHERNLKEGYEGSIFRTTDSAYVPSYNEHRSMTTIKWKPVHRMELQVVGFDSGKKGKALDLVRWVLKVPGARGKKDTITLDPKWTDDERRQMLEELRADPAAFDNYKGRYMTIEYQALSKDNMPLRAKAVGFRDYL